MVPKKKKTFLVFFPLAVFGSEVLANRWEKNRRCFNSADVLPQEYFSDANGMLSGVLGPS